jgi:hypothetical protein
LNALRSGLLSDEPVVISGAETVAGYRKVRRRILHDLHLEGAMELALGEQIVRTVWRLRRVPLYEAAVLSEEMRRVDKEVAAEIGKDAAKDKREVLNPWHPLFQMARNTLKRSLELLKRLPKMPPKAPVKSQRALDLLLFVAQIAKVPFEEVVLPGVPDDPLRRAVHPWTVGNVKDAIPAIALKARCDPEGLETLARLKVTQLLTEQDVEAKPLLAKRQARQHRHLLPQGPALDGILRYEAHLSRLLVRDLTQLEVAQAPRRGESTPLARLDIQGLPDA